MTKGEAFLRKQADYPYYNGVVDFRKYLEWRRGPSNAYESLSDWFTIVEIDEFNHIKVTANGSEKQLLLNVNTWGEHDLAVGDTFNGDLYRRVFLNCWNIEKIVDFRSKA